MYSITGSLLLSKNIDLDDVTIPVEQQLDGIAGHRTNSQLCQPIIADKLIKPIKATVTVIGIRCGFIAAKQETDAGNFFALIFELKDSTFVDSDYIPSFHNCFLQNKNVIYGDQYAMVSGPGLEPSKKPSVGGYRPPDVFK